MKQTNHINLYLGKFLRGYKFLRTAKLIWRKPEATDTIIIDDPGGCIDILQSALAIRNPHIMYMRGEEINIIVLLLALWLKLISDSRITEIYVYIYLKLARARLAVTTIDNRPSVFKIKTYCPGVATVVIQNGIRDCHPSTFEIDFYLNKREMRRGVKLEVDLFLVFNTELKNMYKAIIKGRIIAAGSLISNSFKRVNIDVGNNAGQVSENGVVFISQWRKHCKDDRFYKRYDYDVSCAQFYSAEDFVLPIVYSWCKSNRIPLTIAASSINTSDFMLEAEYYSSILASKMYTIVCRKNYLSSYELIDNARFVVTIDSTLGYESISRGNKTILLPVRSEYLGWNDFKFAWPQIKPDIGTFWCNKLEPSVIESLLNYANRSTHSEWDEMINNYGELPILMDAENTSFYKLLSQLKQCI
jgi:surface carbohydrate biosynthesis protein